MAASSSPRPHRWPGHFVGPHPKMRRGVAKGGPAIARAISRAFSPIVGEAVVAAHLDPWGKEATWATNHPISSTSSRPTARVALRRTVHAPWIRGMRERDPGLRKGRSNDVSSRTRARACRAHVQQDTGAAALAAGNEAVVGRGAGSGRPGARDLGATGAGARCFPPPVCLCGYAASSSPSRVARVLWERAAGRGEGSP